MRRAERYRLEATNMQCSFSPEEPTATSNPSLKMFFLPSCLEHLSLSISFSLSLCISHSCIEMSMPSLIQFIHIPGISSHVACNFADLPRFQVWRQRKLFPRSREQDPRHQEAAEGPGRRQKHNMYMYMYTYIYIYIYICTLYISYTYTCVHNCLHIHILCCIISLYVYILFYNWDGRRPAKTNAFSSHAATLQQRPISSSEPGISSELERRYGASLGRMLFVWNPDTQLKDL